MKGKKFLFGRDKKSPCDGCTEETGRFIGCHGVCMRYAAWKHELDAERNAIRDKKNEEMDAEHYTIERHVRIINNNVGRKKRKGVL